MSLKSTLVLMWVFLALGGIWFYDSFHRQPAREEAEDRAKHVVWLKDKKIESLEVSVPGREKVRLVCAQAGGCPPDGSADWKLEAPLQDRGDASSVGSLASALLNLTHLEKIEFGEEKPDPREFGLGEKAKVMEVKLHGEAEPVRVEAGAPTAVGPNVYLWSSRDPQTIFVVASFFPQMMDKELFHWRNKRLFPEAATEKVSALDWKGKTSVSARKEEDRWQLLEPVKVPGHFVMIEGLVSTLAYAVAKSVFSESREAPEARKILGKRPELSLRMREGEKDFALQLYALPGKGPREYVAAVDGEKRLFRVDAHSFDRFQKPLLEYRERRLFPERDRVTVEEIVLRFPRQKKEITLKADGPNWVWSAGEKPEEALSQERIRAFLAALFDTEAKAFLPATSQGARLLKGQPADLDVTLKGNTESSARFLVLERKSALTGGFAPGEVRSFGEDFLKVLPIRLQDLYESNNKQVVSETKKDSDGHNHSHGHEPGDGHDH